jgi:hypothetical protein
MCTCASCSYTDKYAGKGFAEWRRGEPAGPRASAGAYAAHVRHSFMGVKMRAEVDRPNGAAWYGVPKGMTRAEVEAVLRKSFETVEEAPHPAEAEAVSPARPSKSAQHFPDLDRQAEAVPSVSKAYRVAYSANDIEELDMRFMSVAQASKEWDISQPRIRQWLADGRVKGAQKVGRDWLIPASAGRPKAAKPGELMAKSA